MSAPVSDPSRKTSCLDVLRGVLVALRQKISSCGLDIDLTARKVQKLTFSAERAGTLSCEQFRQKIYFFFFSELQARFNQIKNKLDNYKSQKDRAKYQVRAFKIIFLVMLVQILYIFKDYIDHLEMERKKVIKQIQTLTKKT